MYSRNKKIEPVDLLKNIITTFLYPAFFIIFPWFGNLHRAVISVGGAILFTLAGTVISVFLLRTKKWYFIWILRLIQFAGFAAIGFSTPRKYDLGVIWFFSMWYGLWIAGHLPDSWLSSKPNRELLHIKEFSFIHGVRLRAWVKSGNLDRPQARFTYRALNKLDGKDLQFLEYTINGTALRVGGGTNGYVMVQYSDNPSDWWSWRSLCRVPPGNKKFNKETQDITVCEWVYSAPYEILFNTQEIKHIVKAFENEGNLDPSPYHWLSKRASEAFNLILPDALQTTNPLEDGKKNS